MTIIGKGLLSDKGITGMEHVAAAGSRAAGQVADAARRVASDSLVQRINAVQDKISHAASQPAGERIRGMAKSPGFKFAADIAKVLAGFADARERGIGVVGSVADAGASVVASRFQASPTDVAINLFSSAVKIVAPSAAPVAQAIADATPSQAIKSGVTSFADTTGAIVQGVAKGDWSAMQNVADQQLQGKYGTVVQGYSMIGTALSGDSKTLNRLSDDAAGGRLGPLAKFGDWLGDGIAEAFMP